LEEYETYRSNRRMSFEMILTREMRDSMLRKEWDISRNDIAAAIRDTIRIKNQRRQTVQNLNKDKVEELLEGATKKIFRSLLFKSSTSHELDLLNQQYNAVQELRQHELQMAKLEQHHHQQQEEELTFGNTGSTAFVTGVKDSLLVIGLDIDNDINHDTAMIDEKVDMEDPNDGVNDDDHLLGTISKVTPAMHTSMKKKPIILIQEDDDDDASIHQNILNSSTFTTNEYELGLIPKGDLPATSLQYNEQDVDHPCTGENSNEDSSVVVKNEHPAHNHAIVQKHYPPPINGKVSERKDDAHDDNCGTPMITSSSPSQVQDSTKLNLPTDTVSTTIFEV
jgi:hypothetical protein